MCSKKRQSYFKHTCTAFTLAHVQLNVYRMTKTKGVAGGRLISIKDEHQYNLLIKYLLQQIDLKQVITSREQRKKFQKKAKMFIVINADKLDDWPFGPTLCVKREIHSQVRNLIYVPSWGDFKQKVIREYHGTGKPCGHFGRDRLHKAVRIKRGCKA